MKYLFISILIVTALPCFSQVSVTVKWNQYNSLLKNDTIYYNPGKKITWQDFKGKPDVQSGATAITSSGFGYLAGIQSHEGKTDIGITVYCYFSKPGSWVRTASDYALNHEQHHFDISFIVTSLFIQKLKAAKFTRNNYDALLEKIYRESCRELEKMQNDYDGQTRNGRLPIVQAEWNEKIEKQLLLLSTI